MTIRITLEPAVGLCAVQVGERVKVIPMVNISAIIEALQQLWSCWPAPSEDHVWSVVTRYAK